MQQRKTTGLQQKKREISRLLEADDRGTHNFLLTPVRYHPPGWDHKLKKPIYNHSGLIL